VAARTIHQREIAMFRKRNKNSREKEKKRQGDGDLFG
jgi:hypothetical protein